MAEVSKYLKLARTAREEGNSENAQKYYELAYEDMPDDPEVKYFASYYPLLNSKNFEAKSRYLNLSLALTPTLGLVAAIEDVEEREALVALIIKTFTPLYGVVSTAVLKAGGYDDYVAFEKYVVPTVIGTGDFIIKLFGEKEPIISLAVEMWKDLIDNLKLSTETNSVAKEQWFKEIGEKIQKYDPNYVIPTFKKPSGCTA